jgi:hypothetical protein
MVNAEGAAIIPIPQDFTDDELSSNAIAVAHGSSRTGQNYGDNGSDSSAEALELSAFFISQSNTPGPVRFCPFSPAAPLAAGNQAVTTDRYLVWDSPSGGNPVWERPRLYRGAQVTILDIQENAVQVRTPEGVEGWIQEPVDVAFTGDLSAIVDSERSRFMIGTRVQIVLSDGIPLRSEPASTAREIEMLTAQQEAAVVDMRGDWLSVQFGDYPYPQEGWVRWFYDEDVYVDVTSGFEAPMPFVRTLFLGDVRLSGEDVAAVQQRLLDLGYSDVGEVDGFYGPMTEAAVKQFRTDQGLDGSQGVVDAITWSLLFK